MNKSTITLLVILVLCIGLAVGYWAARLTPVQPAIIEMSGAPEPLFYRHPMNPEISSPTPAKDEMGMDYVPVFANDQQAAMSVGTVLIDPVTVQNIGVRTARAEQRDISHKIHAVGRIGFDERRLAKIHSKTEGWIEKLFIERTGEPVTDDTILLSLYSPKLVSSQEEYLLALKNKKILSESPFEDISRGAIDLASAARQRLALMDVPEHQIRELETSGNIKKNLHIHSPFDGIVMNVGVREGQHVTPMTELYMIADLNKVWAYVDIYENELSWVNVGDEVEMQITGIPGRVFKSRISYIYPYLEANTRTVKARVELDNPGLILKPDMFADVTINAGLKRDVIVVPSEAIIRSGTREQVFVVREPGKFEPRVVTLGVSAGSVVQIIEGIEAGEEVVTSAQFLIDSESKLSEATAKMLDQTGQLTTGSAEGVDMDMKMDMDMQMDMEPKQSTMPEMNNDSEQGHSGIPDMSADMPDKDDAHDMPDMKNGMQPGVKMEMNHDH